MSIVAQRGSEPIEIKSSDSPFSQLVSPTVATATVNTQTPKVLPPPASGISGLTSSTTSSAVSSVVKPSGVAAVITTPAANTATSQLARDKPGRPLTHKPCTSTPRSTESRGSVDNRPSFSTPKPHSSRPAFSSGVAERRDSRELTRSWDYEYDSHLWNSPLNRRLSDSLQLPGIGMFAPPLAPAGASLPPSFPGAAGFPGFPGGPAALPGGLPTSAGLIRAHNFLEADLQRQMQARIIGSSQNPLLRPEVHQAAAAAAAAAAAHPGLDAAKTSKLGESPFFKPTLGGLGGAFGGLTPGAGSSSGAPPGAPIPAGLGSNSGPSSNAPKKTGKWCAAHVSVAWRIHAHAKDRTSRSSSLDGPTPGPEAKPSVPHRPSHSSASALYPGGLPPPDHAPGAFPTPLSSLAGLGAGMSPFTRTTAAAGVPSVPAAVPSGALPPGGLLGRELVAPTLTSPLDFQQQRLHREWDRDREQRESRLAASRLTPTSHERRTSADMHERLRHERESNRPRSRSRSPLRAADRPEVGADSRARDLYRDGALAAAAAAAGDQATLGRVRESELLMLERSRQLHALAGAAGLGLPPAGPGAAGAYGLESLLAAERARNELVHQQQAAVAHHEAMLRARALEFNAAAAAAAGVGGFGARPDLMGLTSRSHDPFLSAMGAAAAAAGRPELSVAVSRPDLLSAGLPGGDLLTVARPNTAAASLLGGKLIPSLPAGPGGPPPLVPASHSRPLSPGSASAAVLKRPDDRVLGTDR